MLFRSILALHYVAVCPQDVPIDTGGLRDEIKSADPNGQRKAMSNNTLLEIGQSHHVCVLIISLSHYIINTCFARSMQHDISNNIS